MILLNRHGIAAAAGASGGGGGATTQINSVTAHAATTNTTTVSSSVSLGAAFAGRILYIVAPYFDGSSASSAPSSVTVGGNSATLLAHIHEASTNTCGVSIWAYQDDGALGTSAIVEVVHPTSRNSLSFAVVNATVGGGSVLDSVADADGYSSVVAQDLDTSGAAALLYCSHFQNGYDPTAPAPFTDGQYTYDENSSEWVCVAWDNSPSGGLESVDLPSGGSPTPLRGAYLALALS